MKTRSILLGLSFLSLAALAGGCSKSDVSAAAGGGEMPPVGVTAVPAVAQDVPVYLDEIGRTVAMDVVSIVPQVAGRITSVAIEDGADVKKGQLLFEIDPRPFEAQVASAKAAVAQAQADLATAASDYKRIQELDKSVISQEEFDEKKNTQAADAAKLDAAQAQLDVANLNVEYTKIYAPIDGRAGARLLVAGNIVKENDKDNPILVIQRLDPIYAEFSVTENDLGTVRKFLAGHANDLGLSPEKGLKVQVDVPGDSKQVLAALNATPAATAAPAGQPTTAPTTAPTSQPSHFMGGRVGDLTFLDNSVQNASGTVKVRATLPNADHYFWPGQFVNCRLILTTKKDAVLVPFEAEQISQQGPYVYVVAADGTAELRPISVGQKQGNMIVVDSGVAAGEKVIVTGQMLLMPKAKVMVMNDKPATPPATEPTK